MASSDLDPVFVKALKLLQSRSKDSYFQLKQMYDEVVAQRRHDAAIKRVIYLSRVPCFLFFGHIICSIYVIIFAGILHFILSELK